MCWFLCSPIVSILLFSLFSDSASHYLNHRRVKDGKFMPVALFTISCHTGLLIFSATSVGAFTVAKLWYNLLFWIVNRGALLCWRTDFCFAFASAQGVGTQEGGYTKGGPLPTINPIWWVTPSSIPLAKLGRAVTTSTWQPSSYPRIRVTNDRWLVDSQPS